MGLLVSPPVGHPVRPQSSLTFPWQRSYCASKCAHCLCRKLRPEKLRARLHPFPYLSIIFFSSLSDAGRAENVMSSLDSGFEKTRQHFGAVKIHSGPRGLKQKHYSKRNVQKTFSVIKYGKITD